MKFIEMTPERKKLPSDLHFFFISDNLCGANPSNPKPKP